MPRHESSTENGVERKLLARCEIKRVISSDGVFVRHHWKICYQEHSCHECKKMIFQELLDPMNENVITLDDSCLEAEVKSSRKRMRLHQLSWEEKIQRKKLRNRIAAQTSRDRKKARMDHLEETVKELQEKNLELSSQIEELQKKNESLLNANAELQKALSSRSYSCTCQTTSHDKGQKSGVRSVVDSGESCISVDHLLEVPAESSNDPQQKGRKTQMQDLMSMTSWTLWKVLTLCLLTQKCWEISKTTHSSMSWKNWQQVCFKKLNNMREEEHINLWRNRPQQLIRENAGILMQWWGKHQKNWNPVEVMA